MLMLNKNPDQRIKLSQFFQNEFILSSSITHTSDRNMSTVSNPFKVKSNTNCHETLINENSINSSKSYTNLRNKSNNTNIPSLLDQNMLQLPSILPSFQSSVLSSEQNCLKSVNSIFIGSSKIEGVSSSNISDFSPTHFTNEQKKSSKTYSSNNFSLNNTIKAIYKSNTSKTNYSSLNLNEIFWDENPVEEFLKELKKIYGKMPHPSKNF